MAIRYLPSKLLNQVAPKKKVSKLVTKNLTLNRAVVSTLANTGILSKKTLTTVALKTIKGYKKRFKDLKEEGLSAKDAKVEAVNREKLLVQRVQNAAIFELSREIQNQYEGEYYEWLPSDAEEPDPEHQLNYGQTFQMGVGEHPGDRYGCRCGMFILVNETKLDL